jgi:hypothetical protein
MQHAWERWKWIKHFVGKPEGKTPLGRSKSMWENRIKIDLKIQEVRIRSRLNWPRIGFSDRLS